MHVVVIGDIARTVHVEFTEVDEIRNIQLALQSALSQIPLGHRVLGEFVFLQLNRAKSWLLLLD